MQLSGTPSGCNVKQSPFPGGLRFAPTSGYSLATLLGCGGRAPALLPFLKCNIREVAFSR
jgi:hypothetical protein